MNQKRGGEKTAGSIRPFSLLQFYQLRNATFWSDEWGAPQLSPEYNTEVLALDPKKNALKASITWLLNNQIIDVPDCEAIERINLHRNELAHDLPQFLATAEREIQIHLFEEIMRLVTKIERWWIINFELAINPDHDGREVDDDKIISGGMLFLQLLLGIATGVNSTDLYEKFKEAIEAKRKKTND